MNTLPQIAFDIRDATDAARARTGDQHIAVKVKQGKARIVRAVPRAGSKYAYDEHTLAGPMPVADIVAALHAL